MGLITWNTQRGRGLDGRVEMDRIAAHAQRFSDFDVLCVRRVSADIAGRVRDVRVDEAIDASDHQPMLLELA